MRGLEEVGLVDALDGVAHILEEEGHIAGHVGGEGHHLDGAGAAPGWGLVFWLCREISRQLHMISVQSILALWFITATL